MKQPEKDTLPPEQDPPSEDSGRFGPMVPGAAIALGMGVGIAIGSAIDNVGGGLVIGIAFGVGLASYARKQAQNDE